MLNQKTELHQNWNDHRNCTNSYVIIPFFFGSNFIHVFGWMSCSALGARCFACRVALGAAVIVQSGAPLAPSCSEEAAD